MQGADQIPIPEQAMRSIEPETAVLPDFASVLEFTQRSVRNILGDTPDADDIAQQVAVNYWQRCERLGVPPSPDLEEGQTVNPAYLGRSVINAIIDHRRRSQRRYRHETPLEPVSEGNSLDRNKAFTVSERDLPSTPSVLAKVSAQETLAEFAKYWDLLSPLQQQCLRLAAQGMGPEEAGTLLNTASESVKGALHRARYTMRLLHRFLQLTPAEVEVLRINDPEFNNFYKRKRRYDQGRSSPFMTTP
jgi:RNA polymerase sigma factor (sigma-70 family)